MRHQQLRRRGGHLPHAIDVPLRGGRRLDGRPPVVAKVVRHVLLERRHAAQLRIVERLDARVGRLVERPLHCLVDKVERRHELRKGGLGGDATEEAGDERGVLGDRVRLARAVVKLQREPTGSRRLIADRLELHRLRDALLLLGEQAHRRAVLRSRWAAAHLVGHAAEEESEHPRYLMRRKCP